MKKINLMIAAGLLASASMQAQTTIASVGFESGDQKYTTETAYTPGGTYGNWVNRLEGDVWTEPYDGDQHSGKYCFRMENTEAYTGNTWERGFMVGNLNLKENTAYRVSFWVKAEPTYLGAEGKELNTSLKSSISIGHEYCDMPISTASGVQYYYNYTSGVMTGDWKRISYVTYFTNKADQDALSMNYTGKEDANGNIVIPQGDPFPNEYFLIINMYNPGEYLLDDIVVEEGVTFNAATFLDDAIKLDFGYPTNIADLAKANAGVFSLDPSCVTVTIDGTAAPVQYVEGQSDGFLYVFLDGISAKEGQNVVVSFTPAADCPIIYTSDRRPSADVESEMKVLGFTNETAYFDETIDVLPSAWAPAQMVSSVPENESFELDPATLKNIAVTYNKELSIDYASATLSYSDNFGNHNIDLTSAMSLSEDKLTVNVALSDLKDGEYTLILSGVANSFGVECIEDQEVTFSLGEDNDDSVSEDIYVSDFDNEMTGGVPEGWVTYNEAGFHLYGFNDEARTSQYNYNWGGTPGGGGTRLYEGFSGDFVKAMYWGTRGTNEGYAEFGSQVKDWILEDGTIDPEMPEGVALKLAPRKYQISFLMAAWKGEPTFTFTLEDLDGNVYAKFEDILAAPNVNGATGPVSGSVKCVTDFTVDKEGYYVLRFTAAEAQWMEYLLANVKLITMPSKAAYYKNLLKVATEEAEAVLETAKGEEYDGDTKTAFSAAINNAKTGHFTSPSEVNAAIAELQALGEKMTARVNNIDDFSIALIEASASYEALAEKYLTSQVAIDAKKVIDQYADTNPSTLSDDQLNEVTPLLKETANKLANLEANASLLTWGITKAVQTYNIIGTKDDAALNAAIAAADDDRTVANNLNAANKLRVLQILANELVDGQIPDAYLTKVNEQEEVDEYDEPTGNTIYDFAGIELTGCVQNPKFYRQLDVDGIPGWDLEAGSDSTSLNIGYGGDAPSAEKPVTDQFINIYGNADYNLSQTLENLPAGIYTIKFSTRTPVVDRTEEFGKIFYYNAQNEAGEWDKYIYAGSEVTPYKGGTWGYGNEDNNTYIENVQVGAEGTLLIGAREHYVSGKAEKHEDNTPQDFWTGTTMCDDVRIFLVAPLAGYDYAKAAEELADAIDTLATGASNAKVAGIYSVSGARVATLQKGINIVKMDNGQVKKVLVK